MRRCTRCCLPAASASSRAIPISTTSSPFRSGPTSAQTLALARKLGRSYDLAVSTQSGDRPTFYAIMASRRRVGLVPLNRSGIWWKRLMLERPVPVGHDCHRFEEMQLLANALGLPLIPDVVCPQGPTARIHRAAHALCGAASDTVRALPAMDRRWLARARARACRAQALGRRDRGARRRRARLCRRHLRLARRDPRARHTRLAGPCRPALRRRGLCRPRYVDDPSRRRQRLPDRGAARLDQSAAHRRLAQGRIPEDVGPRRHRPKPRQRVGGAESAALPALRRAWLRTPPQQLQPLPR